MRFFCGTGEAGRCKNINDYHSTGTCGDGNRNGHTALPVCPFYFSEEQVCGILCM